MAVCYHAKHPNVALASVGVKKFFSIVAFIIDTPCGILA